MKKKGLILLLALSVMVVTGCGNQNTSDDIQLEAVADDASEEVLLDQPTEGTTQEPTTRIVEKTEEKTTEANTLQVSDGSEGVTAISPEDATAMLQVTLGEKDKDTGNEYSYGYIENVQVDGVTYLAFDWRWMVDGDHMSRLGNLFVTADGSKIYSGVYNGPEDCTIDLDDPMN